MKDQDEDGTYGIGAYERGCTFLIPQSRGKPVSRESDTAIEGAQTAEKWAIDQSATGLSKGISFAG